MRHARSTKLQLELISVRVAEFAPDGLPPDALVAALRAGHARGHRVSARLRDLVRSIFESSSRRTSSSATITAFGSRPHRVSRVEYRFSIWRCFDGHTVPVSIATTTRAPGSDGRYGQSAHERYREIRP